MTSGSGKDDGRQLVIVRRFVNEPQAAVYQAILHNAGISCFLSNTHTGTLIPFVNGGFLLHVMKDDVQDALQIIQKLDENARTRVDTDYRDADLGDIAYEKAIYEHETRIQNGRSNYWIIGAIVLFILCYLVYMFFYAGL